MSRAKKEFSVRRIGYTIREIPLSSDRRFTMRYLKILLICFTSLLLLTACGGSNDSDVSSGSGSGGETASSGSTSQKVCTGDDLKGTWRITAMVGPLSETEDAVFDGSESPGNNEFNVTREGITLMGTIDPSCNSISGTATDGNLSGTFTAVKLSS